MPDTTVTNGTTITPAAPPAIPPLDMSDKWNTGRQTVLKVLQKAYTRTEMNDAISKSVPALYKGSSGYLEAILDAFYGELPKDSARGPKRIQLSLTDRERVLIAILASQNDGAALAIHMYSALMEGVTSEEIAHILMLAGTYTGVSHFTRALFVQKILLEKLVEIAMDANADKKPNAVVKALLIRFEPALMLPERKPGT